MTPAEIRTYREGLGLSTAEMGRFLKWRLHHPQCAAGDVEAWESGRAVIPEDAATEILSLDASLERIVIESLNREGRSRGTGAILIRYENPKDVRQFDPHLTEMSGPVALQAHSALIARLSQGLKRMGRNVRIVYMDRGAYHHWRSDQRIEESEAARLAWASGEVAVGA